MRKFGFIALLLAAATVATAQPLRVTNAASFLVDDEVSPGSIVAIFGKDLAATTASAPDAAAPPLTLGGITVSVAGQAAPLYYVSPRQVNARIPATVPVGTAEVVVNSPGGAQKRTIKIEAADPGVFSTRGSGSRDGAVLDAVTFDPSPFRVMRNGQPVFLAIYATGLNLATAPAVSIGGVSVPVAWYGAAPCCQGLQQINVQLLPQLAGAGRVPVAVTSGGKTSNVVEIVLLPDANQQAPQPAPGMGYRAREIATLAWVPGTNQVLLADENDDVVRVLDAVDRKVLATIALPDGSEPSGIAVWTGGTPALAVVALRDKNQASIIDLVQRKVLRSVATGNGPAGVVIVGNRAVVANQESDSVSIFDVTAATPTVTAVAVGRAPVSVDKDDSGLALVANQLGGSLSVVNVTAGTAASPIPLGTDVRPHTVRALSTIKPWAIVTDPTSSDGGRVLLVNFVSGAILKIDDVNPARSGGLSDVATLGPRAFFASQMGGAVVAAVFKAVGASAALDSTTIVKTGLGARAVAVDPAGKWLAVSNEGSGTVTIIDLGTMAIAGSIRAVRSNDENDEDEQGRSDRDHAVNAPTITQIAPNQGSAGSKFSMTILGTNFTDASDLEFILPGMKGMPPQSQGRGRGPSGREDPNITVSNIKMMSDGRGLTADVSIAANAVKSDRIVRVKTPNGESTAEMTSANRFTVK